MLLPQPIEQERDCVHLLLSFGALIQLQVQGSLNHR